MSDFDDIACDYVIESEPRLSDLEMEWPSDEAIAGFIRAASRWHPNTPVPDGLIRAFRRHIIERAYAAWYARCRRRRVPPLPRGFTRRQKRWYEVALDLMTEDWVRVGMVLLTGASAMALWAAREVALFSFRDAPRHIGGGLREYMHTKLDLPGRAPRSCLAWSPSPLHMAVVNAISPESARLLHDHLDVACRADQHFAIDRLGRNLEAIGLRIVQVHGDWISVPLPGPPRGMWPTLPAEVAAARKKRDAEAAAKAEAAVEVEVEVVNPDPDPVDLDLSFDDDEAEAPATPTVTRR